MKTKYAVALLCFLLLAIGSLSAWPGGQVHAQADNIHTVNSTGDARDFVPFIHPDFPDFPRCWTAAKIAGDIPECTLRAAIEEANISPGPDTILFNIPATDPGCGPTGVCTIRPGAPIVCSGGGFNVKCVVTVGLPVITSPVFIDGYSQPGASPNTNPFDAGTNAVLKIELDGSNVPEPYRSTGFGDDHPGGVVGLEITGGNSSVRGLVINRWPSGILGADAVTLSTDAKNNGIGIVLLGLGGNFIEGNFIGTDATGTIALPNESEGVVVLNDSGFPNTIGGTDPAARNLISGNESAGVVFGIGHKGGDLLQGNLIGTKANGQAPLGNTSGVIVVSPANTIGGGDADDSVVDGRATARNVISGNADAGILVVNFKGLGNPTNNRIRGNLIGTNVDGTTSDPDGQPDNGDELGNAVGIQISNAHGNNIGGNEPGQGNLISGNAASGIQIDEGSSGNIVEANFIGTDQAGMAAIPNGGSGVLIEDSPNNIIGSTETTRIDPEVRLVVNRISGNTQDGITVRGAQSIGNKIFSNHIGIDNGFGMHLLPQPLPNGGHGIQIDGAANTELGFPELQDPLPFYYPLVVSGNKLDGVHITGAAATGNKLVNGSIGGDERGHPAKASDGRSEVANGRDGVAITSGAHENFIGDVLSGRRNVISGNRRYGVFISGSGTDKNIVRGNRIGNSTSDLTAGELEVMDFPLENLVGVFITDGAKDNVIGGKRTPASKPVNVISGNETNGVALVAAGEGNQIQGNFIGPDTGGGCWLRTEEGKCLLGNDLHGIYISETNKTLIGSKTEPLEGNVIAWNGTLFTDEGEILTMVGHGVQVASGTGNTIRKNSVFLNVRRGINLAKPEGQPNSEYAFGVNDFKDLDTGPNQLVNYPVVTRVSFGATTNEVTWSLYAEAGKEYTVEVFDNSNNGPDPSGFGGGETLERTFTMMPLLTPDGDGVDESVAHHTISVAKDKLFLSATATDPDGNTSEFSMVDTDGDALADAWEIDAPRMGGIDVDEDGTLELELGRRPIEHERALPNQKDVFVEIDAMNGRAPNLFALQDVQEGRVDLATVERRTDEGFINAPAALVQNPNGEPGIRLHLELDEMNLTRQRWPSGSLPAPFYEAKAKHFGDTSQRLDPLRKLAAKRLAYRYAIYADHVPDTAGQAEIGGNDLYLALRTGNAPDETEAGTFMHELGHSLNLGHGGALPGGQTRLACLSIPTASPTTTAS